MEHVPGNSKNVKYRCWIIGGIIIIVSIVGCMIGLAIKRKVIQTIGISLGKQMIVSVYIIEEEEQYIEFEKLFREQQDDIKEFTEELLGQNLLEKRDYRILFNEESYLTIPCDNEFVYNDGTFKAVNENAALKKILNSFNEKGVITDISAHMSGDTWILYFYVDTEFTPFITGNNGVRNAFVYCEDEEFEKYRNRKVEDNWYLWISPAPE